MSKRIITKKIFKGAIPRKGMDVQSPKRTEKEQLLFLGGGAVIVGYRVNVGVSSEG